MPGRYSHKRHDQDQVRSSWGWKKDTLEGIRIPKRQGTTHIGDIVKTRFEGLGDNRQGTTHISDIVQARFEYLGVGGIVSPKRQSTTHISDIVQTRFEGLGTGGVGCQNANALLT